MNDEIVITDDLELLLDALPPRIRLALRREGLENLLEIVLDLGRMPEARYPGAAKDLGGEPVTAEDLAYVVGRIGQFGDDNRAGIERTLHRISAIRNRRGEVVGLTCRVGRAVRGPVALIRDVVEQGKSILILGRPGVGKTTLLREAARVLADELGKRVVVVDTSNEIAGDGDIPHPGIGRARRMQVRHPTEQHAVMIEAVENHMPEVIVIDEIGTELEAQAARTIAERGVQLVGTAHGRTLDNLLLNPTLADLVGGIQAVTLGDEEARRRGTQKTVLERKAPPTFDVLIEQEERNLMGVHLDVAAAVDELLRGEAPTREMRERLEDGSIRRWKEHAPRMARADGVGLPAREAPTQRVETGPRRGRSALAGSRAGTAWWDTRGGGDAMEADAALARPAPRWLDPELARSAALAAERGEPSAIHTAEADGAVRKRRIYPLGVSRARLDQVIRELNLPAVISRDERDADALLTIKSMYRKQPDRVDAAQASGLPVYVLRSGGMDRLRETLAEMFHVERRLPLTGGDGASGDLGDEDEGDEEE
jgi:stage III sporulation protein SpoIIIAA